MSDIAGAITVIAFLAFAARMLFGPLVIFGTKNNDHVINVQIPQEADKAIQKIAEAYITLDKARSEHPLTEQDVQASLLEARAIVAAHINTRISIVTGEIENVTRQYSRNLKHNLRASAQADRKALDDLEAELTKLQTSLGSSQLKAV